MSSSSYLKRVLSGLASAFQPLRDALASPDALASFVRQFGWTFDSGQLATIQQSLAGATTLAANPDNSSLEQLAADLASLATLIRSLSGSSAPATFTSTFPQELLEFTLYSALAQGNPGLFGLLRFGGVFSEQSVAADSTTNRDEHVLLQVHWDRLQAFVSQPLAAIKETYGWGGTFDGDTWVRSLGILLRGFGGRVSLYPADPAVVAEYYSTDNTAAAGLQNLVLSIPTPQLSPGLPVGVKLALLAVPIPPAPDTAAAADGVALLPVISGQASTSLSISPEVSLSLSGDFLSRPLRAEIHPGRSLIRADIGDSHVDASVRLDATAPASSPWIPFGDATSSRIEVSEVQATLGMSGDLSGDLDLSVECAIKSGSIVLDFSEADGFLQETVSSQPTRLPLALSLKWSSKTGFSINGLPNPALETTLPLNLSASGFGLGVSLSALQVGLRGQNGGVVAEASTTVNVALGPVHAVIQDVGASGTLTFPQSGGNLCVADLGVGFKPPSGVGLSIDAQGLLAGGGSLLHIDSQDLYAGTLQLTLQEDITLKAFGLISTRMPDGSRGYSLVVFITAEGFQPIPLGLGFTLLGIGGMLAINRTFSEDALRQGMQNDSLATLLFPPDPSANPGALIQSLSTIFPASSGSYLLGILVKIGWFTPTLVLLDLALIFEFGTRERLIALGRVSALLPSAQDDLIRINLDAVGVVDFDADTVAIDAVLVDSRLAHRFPITGAAALRAGWGSGPGSTFVLAVGGLNPRFTPPAGFPGLQRLAIALSSGNNPRLVCDAYFAITSNTVQFGAHASLFASADGFSIEGDLGFDVLLLQIAPPRFIADFAASVALKRGSFNLFAVELDGTLQGVQPLALSGKATFKVLWFHFSVRFNATLVSGNPPPGPPAVDVKAELLKALTAPTSWSTQRSGDQPHGVVLSSLPQAAGVGAPLVLDPFGQLVIKQQVVPLNTGRDIDTYGGAPVTGDRRFSLTAAVNGSSLTGQAVQEDFAPVQYFVMSDDEKLSAPSFESMDGGYVFSSTAATYDPTTIVAAPVGYETIVAGAQVTPAATAGAGPATPQATAAAPAASVATSPPPYTMTAEQLNAFSRSGAASRAPLRRVGRARFRNRAVTPTARVKPAQWAIVPRDTGAPASLDPSVRTWSDYQGALNTLNRGGARWQLLPLHEIAS